MEIEPAPAFSVDAIKPDNTIQAPKTSYSEHLKNLTKLNLSLKPTFPYKSGKRASRSCIKRGSSGQKTVSFITERVEPDSLDEGSPVPGSGELRITEVELCLDDIDAQADPTTFASTHLSQGEEEIPQVTTAGTQTTFENVQEDESPVLFNDREAQFAFEEEVRISETKFGESPCLAYCNTCKQRALTVIQDHKTWFNSCFIWLRCFAPQEAQHLCGNCGEVLSRVNAN
mmetsp:Transcript_18575/g.33559  ORF Transcript_18575/g.33559 Transcript_18575/m.33559 type:complete len:229 (+) Transcript_18575:1169-1855(+)